MYDNFPDHPKEEDLEFYRREQKKRNRDLAFEQYYNK